MPTMIRKLHENDGHRRPVFGRPLLEPLDLAVQAMGEDQTTGLRNGDLVVRGLLGSYSACRKDQKALPVPSSKCASIAAIFIG